MNISASVHPHHHAFEKIKAQPALYCKVTAEQLVLRLIGLAPIFYWLFGGRFSFLTSNKVWYFPIALALTLILYFFLVFPIHYIFIAHLCCINGHSHRKSTLTWHHYKIWLRYTWVRFTRAFCGALPFLAAFGFFFYSQNLMKANKADIFFRSIGGSRDVGYLVYLSVTALLGIFMCCVWCRDCVLDYQPVCDIGIKQAVQRAKKARKAGARKLTKTILGNILLMLPFAAAVLLTLIFHYNSLIVHGAGVFRNLQNLLRNSSLPDGVIVILCLAYLLLDLPLWQFRKLSVAGVVQYYSKQSDTPNVKTTADVKECEHE